MVLKPSVWESEPVMGWRIKAAIRRNLRRRSTDFRDIEGKSYPKWIERERRRYLILQSSW